MGEIKNIATKLLLIEIYAFIKEFTFALRASLKTQRFNNALYMPYYQLIMLFSVSKTQMKTFKRSKAIGFLDEDLRLQNSVVWATPWNGFQKEIDFELFRSEIIDNLHVEPKNKGGRRPDTII